MTDDQFDMLMAAQLTQINLLKSIDANLAHLAMGQKPTAPIHPNWRNARDELKNAVGVWKSFSQE